VSVDRLRVGSPLAEETGAAVALAPRGTGRRGVLTTTVPREYVHRAALAEVIPIGWERCGESRFAVYAQWPRAHALFTHGALRSYDATIVAETIRQAGLLICHAELGVPLGHQFLLHDLFFRVDQDELGVGPTPAMLEIDVTCTEVKQRGGRLSGLRYEMELLRDGEPLAAGGASASIIAPRVYWRMRGDVRGDVHGATAPAPTPLPAPVVPCAVGRVHQEDVVLAQTGEPDRWQLRMDTSHPVLFDHPVDHAPGMVLVEAAKQAAMASLGRPDTHVVGMACEFTRFIEFDAPCFIQACRLPSAGAEAGDSVLVTSRQHDEQAFSARVTLAAIASSAAPGSSAVAAESFTA
jgi:2-oxo-3-(phosphooxy)propyl 3-oxoalkanoate synthase